MSDSYQLITLKHWLKMKQSSPINSTCRMLELASILDGDIHLLDSSLCQNSNTLRDLELASSLNFDSQMLESPLVSADPAARTVNPQSAELLAMATSMKLEDLFSLDDR